MGARGRWLRGGSGFGRLEIHKVFKGGWETLKPHEDSGAWVLQDSSWLLFLLLLAHHSIPHLKQNPKTEKTLVRIVCRVCDYEVDDYLHSRIALTAMRTITRADTSRAICGSSAAVRTISFAQSSAVIPSPGQM